MNRGSGPPAARPRGRRWALVRLVVREAGQAFLRNQHMDTAAMLSYYGFLSIVPLLLLVSVLTSRLVLASEVARDAIQAGAEELISGFGVVALEQLQTLSQQRIWGVLGVLFLFWSVTPIAAGFRAAMTRVFQPDRPIGMLKAKLRDIVGAITLVAMFFLLVAGRIVYGVILRHFPERITVLAQLGHITVSFVFAAGCLAFLIVVFTPVRLRAGELFSGAVVSAGLLLVIHPAFAAFLRYNPDYGFAFGSLKAVFITLTWVYVSFVAILFGAEIIAAALRRDVTLLRTVLLGDAAPRRASPALVGHYSRLLAEGEVLFREGDEGGEMFFVRSGAVAMNRGDLTLKIMRVGEYFGELSILINSPRTATAVAVEDAEVVEISKRRFELILRESPDIAIAVLRELADRLKATDQALVNKETVS